MQMENNWKVMKEENGKQHNGQNMLKEPGQFPAQDIPNDDEQLTMRDLTVGYDRIPLIKNINLDAPARGNPHTDRSKRLRKIDNFKDHHQTA